ncbi:UDP-glucuronosyltransferase [Paenibacillus sp. J31TS4]|uniref:MGDG synthase family glycosyltransferase n=1 Tax=Paenibacillus sp. J31TS4 TaxID=2807195 RepID=UPI001B25BF4E|nr:glycosyltransferase [Paenibacillus sp. J31TS4]GIP40008.1 UDP-glucuronosyltransferase [Paenibacillus sp. J31TS4]
MKKKRVLLLSEGFGSGHTQAAHALSVGLRSLSPNVLTRVLELGAFQHPTIAPWIFSAYRKAVMSQPKLYGMLYRYQYKKSLNKLTQLALHRIFYGRTAAIIRQLRPDLIVCTHPFPNVVVSRLKRAGLQVPLITVITDYDAHGTWIDPEVNRYFVSTPEVRGKLLAHGVSEERVEVTGIPVHPDFWITRDQQAAREELGLRDLPTVLVMGGGWGLLGDEALIRYMTEWRDRLQLVFCTGSNDKLREQMESEPALAHPNIRLLGFTKQVDRLMDAADLLVTKPGGMTSTEALAKGLPMLFYNQIPGQEEENSLYFLENGYAEEIVSRSTIDRWFERLVRHRDEFERRRAWMRGIQKPESPHIGSQKLLDYLESHPL